MPARKKVARKKASSKTATKKKVGKKVTKKKAAAGKATAKGSASQKKVVKKKAAKKVAKKTAKKTAKKAAKKATKKAGKKKAAPKSSKQASAGEAKPARPASPTGGPLHGFEPYHQTRGETYMGEEMEAHFRSILWAWKRELMEEVDRTVHHMKDEAANFPDPNDRATQESEFSLELRTRDRERKLLKKIEEALEALDDEEYGYCESCGVEIGVRRLEARPTATLCIDCKTLDEIREKQLAG